MLCALRESGMDLALRASAAARESRSLSNPSSKTARSAAIEEIMQRLVRAFAVALVVASAAACASVGTGPGNGGGAPGPVPDQLPPRPGQVWPMKVREHVDLWLHGFAMLQEDTTFVPFFKRGYGTEMTVLK